MPWQMSHAAYTESESAELQTDVMRFMAILAFCLVAIFAIVQSIPATPAPLTDGAVAATAPAPATPVPPDAPIARPIAEPPPAPVKPIVLQRPKPVVAQQRDEPVRLRRAVPKPRDRAPAPIEVTRPAARAPQPATVVAAPDAPARVPAPPVDQGLSLRFESDAVLRSLVARGLVDLYAISGNTFYRMNVADAGVRFQPGAAPSQYHEMIAGTVPGEVRRSFSAPGSQVTWGVTLPAATSQQLARFVRTNYSGSLVITADARLALAGRGGV